MRSNRAKDTKPELALRRALHARGLRYRLHAADVPGRPDLVIRSLRLAVFIDGDFWHGNRWRLRGLARLEDDFHSNRAFWVAKITRNVERDRAVNERLAADDWTVVRVWESDVLRDVDRVADLVEEAIRSARAAADGRVRNLSVE
ncbi:MAG: very short patch repair endonuclease [Euzebyales bacterium]|jgi:DNA mismatch endonuclease (patch repair protein)|nr:very short patch repair endonuclease [Euzebyales bacterium]